MVFFSHVDEFLSFLDTAPCPIYANSVTCKYIVKHWKPGLMAFQAIFRVLPVARALTSCASRESSLPAYWRGEINVVQWPYAYRRFDVIGIVFTRSIVIRYCGT